MPCQISISKHMHIHHDGFIPTRLSIDLSLLRNTAGCKYTVSSNIDESTWQTQRWGEHKKATSLV
jgi:hypothetical protein